jgi:hypothetical protein
MGINQRDEIKDLYKEKFKTPKNKIEEDTRRWKTSHVHGSAESILYLH